jgi:aminoglycoside phosphotransferase (APT) family kinase protein
MHSDEIEIDEPLVRGLLARQFPQWATLPIEKIASTSTVNAIFRVGDRIAARLPRTPRWHNVQAECCWLQTVASRLPLAVPEPVAIGEPDDTYPFDWAVFRWLDGENWRIDRLANSSLEASRLADFLHALHEIRRDDAPCTECIEQPRLENRDAVVRAFAAKAPESVDARSLLAAWERALSVPAWSGTPLLVHSDLMAGNLLVRDGRLVGVIDWASTHFGDPATDLQAAWRLFSGESRRVFKAALPFDDDTWERARGWVLTSIVGVVYYARTNPAFAEENRLALVDGLAEAT